MKLLYISLLLLLFIISCNNNSAVNSCKDSCSYEGEFSCKSNHIMVCIIDSDGCLTLQENKDCTDEYLCSNGVCGCKIGSYFEDNICKDNRKNVNCNLLDA